MKIIMFFGKLSTYTIISYCNAICDLKIVTMTWPSQIDKTFVLYVYCVQRRTLRRAFESRKRTYPAFIIYRHFACLFHFWLFCVILPVFVSLRLFKNNLQSISFIFWFVERRQIIGSEAYLTWLEGAQNYSHEVSPPGLCPIFDYFIWYTYCLVTLR